MKIFNKLIPILSGSCLAVLAPMVLTSCGGIGTSDFDYLPSISQHELNSYNTTQANNEYFAKAQGQSEIIAQDFLAYFAASLKQEKVELESKYRNVNYTFKANVENLKVESHIINQQTFNLVNGTFSYSYSVSLDHITTDAGYENKLNHKESGSMKFDLTNVPFQIFYWRNLWLVSINEGLLAESANNWSMTISGSSSITEIITNKFKSGQVSESSDVNTTYSNDNPFTDDDASIAILGFFTFTSYYFNNISLSPIN